MIDDYPPRPPLATAPKSLRGVTMVLWLALGIEAFFAVLSIAAYALRLHVIRSIETGAPLTVQTVRSSDNFVRVTAQLSIPMLIAVLVVLLVWVHAARRNLDSFRSGPFRFSPALSVWSFIIPVASLWWPYLVLREIWRGSDPALAPFSPEPFWTRRGSPLIGLWWGAFLVNDLFAVCVGEFAVATRSAQSLGHLRLLAQLYIASHVLRIVSVALSAVVAHRILRRQEALGTQPRSAPAGMQQTTWQSAQALETSWPPVPAVWQTPPVPAAWQTPPASAPPMPPPVLTAPAPAMTTPPAPPPTTRPPWVD
jgi:Domain of unknown function (DUF4328)